MRIVLFYQRVVVAGGAERLLVEELQALLDAGFDARVACFALDRRAVFDKSHLIERFDVLEARSRAGEVWQLRRLMRTLRPDVVIAHTHIGASYVMVATVGLRIPYVTHIHGSLFWLDGDRLKYARVHSKRFERIRQSVKGHQEFIAPQWESTRLRYLANEALARLDRKAVRSSSAVITLTEQLQWEIELLYDVTAVVVRGCLTDDQLARRGHSTEKCRLGWTGKRILLSAGRLDIRKRIDVILRAFELLKSEYPDLFLVVGGTGPENDNLRDLAVQLGISHRVEFVGFIPDEELPSYYAGADLFVFPSWTSSGITPYEALAQGCPVVWTSEATEPILDWDSIVVTDPDPRSVSSGIRMLLERNQREHGSLTDYSWSVFNRGVIDIVRRVAGHEG